MPDRYLPAFGHLDQGNVLLDVVVGETLVAVDIINALLEPILAAGISRLFGHHAERGEVGAIPE